MFESEEDKMFEKKTQYYLQRYDTSDMKRCEYIEAMKKVYFKPPIQLNGKCEGYRGSTGKLSIICKNCSNKKETE